MACSAQPVAGIVLKNLFLGSLYIHLQQINCPDVKFPQQRGQRYRLYVPCFSVAAWTCIHPKRPARISISVDKVYLRVRAPQRGIHRNDIFVEFCILLQKREIRWVWLNRDNTSLWESLREEH